MMNCVGSEAKKGVEAGRGKPACLHDMYGPKRVHIGLPTRRQMDVAA